MFAKNKISQSMIDAVNSIIDEKKENSEVQQLNEAGTGHVIIPTATGTKVYGNSGYGSAKAHRDQTQHSLDTERGPSEKQLTGKDPDLKYKKNPPSTSKNYNKFGAHMSKIDQKGHEVSGHYEKNEEVEVDEELKGNQHKIDKNKNNKIDAEDFKLLRKEDLKGDQHKIDANKNNKIDAGDFELLRKKKVKESYFVSRLLDHAVFAEEIELELNEVLSKDADAGDFIHDFIHSDNPKFAGKTKAERKKMALGAYYSKHNESFEDEHGTPGEKHDDEKEDKALVKKMVKKNALKENNSAMATGAITTDTLAGRVDGGKSDSFKSFKLRVNPVDKEGDGSVRTPDCEEPEETSARSSIKARGGEVEVKGGNEKYKDFHKEEIEELDEKEGTGGSDPLANRQDYAKRHGTGQVYKKTHAGDKTGMTQAFAYDIKRSGPKGKLPEEVEQVEEASTYKLGRADAETKEFPIKQNGEHVGRLEFHVSAGKLHHRAGNAKDVSYDKWHGNPNTESLVNAHVAKHEAEARKHFAKKLKEEVELEEVASPKKGEDAMSGKQNLTPAKKGVVGTVKSDLKNFGRFLAGKKETNEAKTLSPGQDDVPFDAPYTTDKPQNVKDKSGAVHTPMSRAKDLARSAMKRVNNEMLGKAPGNN
jgi:hypothetical protein